MIRLDDIPKLSDKDLALYAENLHPFHDEAVAEQERRRKVS